MSVCDEDTTEIVETFHKHNRLSFDSRKGRLARNADRQTTGGNLMHARISTGMMMLALVVMSTGCQVPVARTGIPVSHNLPPAQMLAEPGPGVGGPGPGVMAASSYATGMDANCGNLGAFGAVAYQKVHLRLKWRGPGSPVRRGRKNDVGRGCLGSCRSLL